MYSLKLNAAIETVEMLEGEGACLVVTVNLSKELADSLGEKSEEIAA